jgi:hypothetical protein
VAAFEGGADFCLIRTEASHRRQVDCRNLPPNGRNPALSWEPPRLRPQAILSPDLRCRSGRAPHPSPASPSAPALGHKGWETKQIQDAGKDRSDTR